MKLIDAIRRRRAAKKQDAATTFWSGIAALNKGGLSKKEHEQALDRLAEAAEALRLSPEDVDSCAELLAEHRGLGDTETLVAEADRIGRERVLEASGLDGEAAELDAEAKRLRAEADGMRRLGNAERSAARETHKRRRQVERELAERGHPQSAQKCEEERHANQVESLQRDLDAVDGDLELPRERHGGDASSYDLSVARVFNRLERKREGILAKLEATEVTP